MDNVVVSRRNHATKKGNKENAHPDPGSKAFIKIDKTSVVPFQPKSNKKVETLAKDGPLKAQVKQAHTRPVSGKDLKKATGQRDGGGTVAAVSDVKRKTHSQVFLAEQAVKHKKIAGEAPKPPAAVLSSKPAPGMYKGKIVQSKIGSIWKSNDTVASADVKPSAPKTGIQRIAVARNDIYKSAAERSGRGIQKSATTRYKSVSERSAQVSRPNVSRAHPAGVSSARPPTRTVPAASSTANFRNTNVAPNNTSGNKNAKPRVPVTDGVKKPTVSSSLSQYRFTVETAEERRAKLAEWLASKGKALKRPAMKTAVLSKTKVDLQSQSCAESQLAEQCKPEPKNDVVTEEPLPAAVAHDKDTHEAKQTTQSQTPKIMNTTLDLLENSDADLPVDSQSGVDDIVLNLCDALEAMATPSRCSDEELMQVTGDESEKELKEEMAEEGEKPKAEQLKGEVEECTDQKVESDEEESDEEELETTPQMSDASVIKYSVKTTPYLQSVKKTIEEEVNTSTSRRKSNIKDLKFLTPVRRSTRIQRKSSILPTMLVDHDVCVSSLAELVKLDEDPNAYIYRRNPALLDGLPDQDVA